MSLSWLPFLSILVLPLVFLILTQIIFKRPRPSHLPPGPSQLPLIGNLHQLGSFSHNSLWSLSKQYGPLMHLQLGTIPALVVSSARVAREVMKKQDHSFCNRPCFFSQRKLSYNFMGIAFAPYGEYWREMRKVCAINLLNAKRIQSFGVIREEEIAQTMAVILGSCLSSNPINLSHTMLTLTSNIICRSAFGRRYVGERSEENEFNRVFEEAQSSLMAVFVGDFIPWMGWVDRVSGQRARLEKVFLDLDAFYEKVIEEHMDPNRPKLQQEDFVDVLIQVQKDLQLTRDDIKAVLLDILVAGTDTGAATVVWAMAELLRNPRVMKKVQDEVRSVIGSKNKVEESDLPQLQYLNLVIKETFRLHPPVPLINRQAIQHCKVDGYNIFPNTLLFINTAAIGRDPDCWENPDEFLPERFIDRDIDYKGQHFELVPFGAGRRICPVLLFGIINVELILANLLYFYDWKLPFGMNKEDMDMSEAAGITVHKKSSLLLIASNYSLPI